MKINRTLANVNLARRIANFLGGVVVLAGLFNLQVLSAQDRDHDSDRDREGRHYHDWYDEHHDQ